MAKRTLLLLALCVPLLVGAQSYSICYTINATVFADDNCDGQATSIRAGNSILASVECGSLPLPISSSTTNSGRPDTVSIYEGNMLFDSAPIVYTTVDNHCFTGTVSLTDPNGVNIDLTLDISPNYNLSISYPVADNNTVGECENVSLSVPSGYSTDLYQWQFQGDTDSWADMPAQFQGNNSITLTIQDLYGANYAAYLNKNVRFRIKHCASGFSNIRTAVFISCSPHLDSFDPVDTQCSYSSDGGFTAIFDRALDMGETLIMTLYGVDGLGNEILLGQQSATTLGANNGYTWPVAQPSGDYLVKYQTENGGTYSTLESSGQFAIGNPPAVVFSATKANDVLCFGGSDGGIDLMASGGVGSFEYQVNGGAWTAFSNAGGHTLTGLSAGTYTIKVRDGNACTERLGNGNDKEETITITQPTQAVSISLVSQQNTTANGFTDGSITVDVSGGTPFGDGSYTFEWRDGSNTPVTSTSAQNVASGHRIILNDIGADTYTLTVTDANYNTATTQGGCTFTENYTITEPPALGLSIQETIPISCNSGNTYGDPGADGELTAIASGGVPFDPLIDGYYAYDYTWKKKDAFGVWQVIPGETTDRLSNIGAGEYAVNIGDANGIVMGTYTNNVLVTANDITYTLAEPDLLQVTLSKTDVFCHNGSDGAITATITGGTGNHAVLWNTGATTQDLMGLTVGTYTIGVTDEKGCRAEASMEILQPGSPLDIQYTFFAPTFAGATDGWIKATITGGTPFNDGSYGFLWKDTTGTDLVAQVTPVTNTDSYELTLNNIGEGNYYLTITDANHGLATDNANCTIVESDHYLEDPEPLTATVTVQSPISCNSANTYGDPYGDGALVCTADGGVQLQPTDNNGLPYYYTWKKETAPGVWTVLSSQTTDMATGLDAGHYAVNVEDANGIILGVYQNNILVDPTDVTFQFDEPPLLELSLAKQDVYCHLGSDGWAEATITGGMPPYTVTWSNGDTTTLAENLSAGTYTVAVTDDRGCQVEGSIEILQPQGPLEINYTAFGRPTTGGATDGWIEAQITGGTALGDGSYTYTWTDGSGALLNARTTTGFTGTSNAIFQIRLDNIPSGDFYLTVEDANHPSAVDQEGCTVIDSGFAMYDPLEASIAVFLPISCNGANAFGNPFSDGQLIATVTGGLPFSAGQPFTYHWKKQDTFGNYIDLPSQTSEIAADLSAGNYALNVEDSLGNVIGIYDSATLIEATDVLFTFEEPQLLEVSLNATAISCGSGNDGTATVGIIGGVAPYDMEWSNGATTETINNLIAGTYFVHVVDARGCEATGQVTVGQPGGLEIEILDRTDPTCYLGNDGRIAVNMTGGQAPYAYLWDTGETTATITDLSTGSHTLQVTDANGCTAFINVGLVDPEPIRVDLGGDRTLCNGQGLALDIGIDDPDATYRWSSDNGFSSTAPSVSLTSVGIYTATVTTGQGCTGTDSIEITTSTADIDSQFLVTSQAFAGEDIILVNTSNPLSDVVDWMVPDQAVILEESNGTVTLRFDLPGAYEVTLRSFQGECYQDITKPVVVEEARDLPDIGDAPAPFIEEFITYPNPTTGSFEVSITLREEATVSLRLFGLASNVPYDDRKAHNAKEYDLQYDVALASGTYFLLLETAKGSEIRKIVIK